MKYINKIIILAILTFICQGCVDLVEDTSSVLTIDNLKSEGDIVAALTPLYRETLEVYKAPHMQRIATYGADDITTWWAGNKSPLRTFDSFDYGNGENSDINWLPEAWNGYWKVIYYANTLIDGLKTSTANEEFVKTGDAEARFFRALAYYHLVRTYGNMPIILDDTTPTGDEERATVLENYKHIENDLLIAESNLPSHGSTVNYGRVSVAAAKTLLADLYLTWAGWPVKDDSKYVLSANKAEEVINMPNFSLLPIDQLWLLENANSNESIFSLQFSDTEDIRSGYAASFSFHEARGWSDVYPELQFFYDFPEGPRKDATFAIDIPQRKVVGGVIVTKDPPTKPYQDSQRGHPMYKKFTISEDLTVANRTAGFRPIEVFRFAEVLLIYAEAEARSGSISNAAEALNKVRRRAAGLPFNTPDPSVDLTSPSVNDIIDEKGWELAGEYKRWFDLIRSERLEEISAKRNAAEQVSLQKAPTKNQYIAPIPFDAISLSNLTQNPEGFIIK